MAITVFRKENEDFNSFYARFKRKCKKAKLFITILEKQYYEKPSEKRNRKKKRKTYNISQEI
jgi:ribosomal protein S21